jgi:hypothetical protein
MTPVQVAASYLGTHDGTVFNRWMRIPLKSMWCLSFALFSLHVAEPANHFPRIARCFTFLSEVSADPAAFDVYTADDIEWGLGKPQAGDIAIFSHNPDADDWDGHAALVAEYLPNGHLRTIEGNTRPTNAGDQRTGNTVAWKERRMGVSGFLLMAIVREHKPPGAE